jgi:hypothetical protein
MAILNSVYGATIATVQESQLQFGGPVASGNEAALGRAIERAAADVNKIVYNRFRVDPAQITEAEYPIDWQHLTQMVEMGAAAYFLIGQAGQQAYDEGRMTAFREALDFMRENPQEWGFYNSLSSLANTVRSSATYGVDNIRANRERRARMVDMSHPGRRGF